MKKIFLMMIAIAALTACDGNKFKVEGTIDGANDSTTLVLEQSSNGEWFIVDSVKVDKNGKFSVSAPAPEVPSIYQLRLGGQAICFPIDSLDHLTINAKLPNFASDYTISGSEHAEQVMKIDKEAMQFATGQASPEQFQAWKDQLAHQIVADPSGIVAYYTINKYIGGKPLFDPLNDNDLRIIGAVANSFNSFRKDDPRTDYLVNLLLEGQRRRRAMTAPPTPSMPTWPHSSTSSCRTITVRNTACRRWLPTTAWYCSTSLPTLWISHRNSTSCSTTSIRATMPRGLPSIR